MCYNNSNNNIDNNNNNNSQFGYTFLRKHRARSHSVGLSGVWLEFRNTVCSFFRCFFFFFLSSNILFRCLCFRCNARFFSFIHFCYEIFFETIHFSKKSDWRCCTPSVYIHPDTHSVFFLLFYFSVIFFRFSPLLNWVSYCRQKEENVSSHGPHCKSVNNHRQIDALSNDMILECFSRFFSFALFASFFSPNTSVGQSDVLNCFQFFFSFRTFGKAINYL